MLDQIKSTLQEAAEGLKLLDGEYCIIGASALILMGIDVGETGDIDVLTSSDNSEKLKVFWADKLVKRPRLKESGLFRSNFGQYQFSTMEVEISGDLEIYKAEKWVPITVDHYHTIQLKDLSVKLPTLDEQIRLLKLFGREKDLKRLNRINEILNK